MLLVHTCTLVVKFERSLSLLGWEYTLTVSQPETIQPAKKKNISPQIDFPPFRAYISPQNIYFQPRVHKKLCSIHLLTLVLHKHTKTQPLCFVSIPSSSFSFISLPSPHFLRKSQHLIRCYHIHN